MALEGLLVKINLSRQGSTMYRASKLKSQDEHVLAVLTSFSTTTIYWAVV